MVAMFEGVGTGPWEYVGSTTGEVWRFKAEGEPLPQDPGIR